jgi:serine phosphatase RsbU (regulator of sigma subunit)
LIGNEKLQDAIEQGKDTGDILSFLNKGIRTSLRQSAEKDTTRDGMDIALCSLSAGKDGVILEFSGANRPMWIIRKGATEIEEVKATKRAIGGFTEEETKFELNRMELNKGDSFYMFSDGYADQFGGQLGKKLTTKKFRELLLSMQNRSMGEQEQELETYMENWKAGREQLDDILVIGVRV